MQYHFWTTQYDFTLNYVGHAETWDKLDLNGNIEKHDCKLSFRRGGKTLAVATIGRDRESLESELAMERVSRLVRPDHRLRHIAASRAEVHYVRICRITKRYCSTRWRSCGRLLVATDGRLSGSELPSMRIQAR
jgi:hypothetical protein